MIKLCGKTIKKTVRIKHTKFRIVVTTEEKGIKSMGLGKVNEILKIMKNIYVKTYIYC